MLVKFGCKEETFNFLMIDSINFYANRLLFFDFQNGHPMFKSYFLLQVCINTKLQSYNIMSCVDHVANIGAKLRFVKNHEEVEVLIYMCVYVALGHLLLVRIKNHCCTNLGFMLLCTTRDGQLFFSFVLLCSHMVSNSSPLFISMSNLIKINIYIVDTKRHMLICLFISCWRVEKRSEIVI
jgi:hypothetical protein